MTSKGKTAQRRSLVEQYEPGEYAEDVLTVLKNAEGPVKTGEIIDAVPHSDNCAHIGLRRLLAAGWIERLRRGTYQFVADPRPSNTDT